MKIAIVLLDGMRGFDVTAALEVFADDRRASGVPANQVQLVSPHRRVTLEHGLRVTPGRLDDCEGPDLVIVPGFAEVRGVLPRLVDRPMTEVLAYLRRATAAGAQLASLCTGAFLLAEAGLLDGCAATTHWRYCDLLAQRHPRVRLQPNVLYTHDEHRGIWTSAGVSAGVDLCLAILAEHHGASAAATVARSMVLPAARGGGQAQYVPPRQRAGESTGMRFEALRAQVREDLTRRWTLGELAAAAHVAPRTLQRRFTDEAGTTPSRWVLNERLTAARELLESSDLTIEQIARRSGFGGSDLLRKHFAAQLTVSPTRYREAFGRRKSRGQVSSSAPPG